MDIYKNSKFARLTKNERLAAEEANLSLQTHAFSLGLSETAAGSLKIKFKKAVISGMTAEQRTYGTQHPLADGKPFYFMEVTTDNDEARQLMLRIIFNLMKDRGPKLPEFHLSLAPNLIIMQENRETIPQQTQKIKELMSFAAR